MVDIGIKPDYVNGLLRIFQRYPRVEKVLVYGSRAMGTHRHNSDIDLCLIGDAVTYPDQYNIAGEIDDLLMPYLVDLSRYAQLENPNFRAHIDAVGKVLYERAPVSAPAAGDAAS